MLNDHPILDLTEEGRWALRQLTRVINQKRLIFGDGQNLSEALSYCFAVSGKLFRPLLFLSFSALCPQARWPEGEEIDLAAAIETLHECSLLHDDIIDHSTIRRGRLSMAAAFNVRTAAHAGAYLAGRSIATIANCCRNSGLQLELCLLRKLAEAQIIEALPPTSNTDEHLNRLRIITLGKTGVLFRLAIQLGVQFGAVYGGPMISRTDGLLLADALAFAYQIRDDILDLEKNDCLRRPGNNDVRKGTANWPVTLWAASCADPELAWRELREAARNNTVAERLRQEILFSGAILKARSAVDEQLDMVHEMLLSLPSSVGKKLLMKIIDCLRLSRPCPSR